MRVNSHSPNGVARYYFGQERCYYDQFCDPYPDYDGPIFAIAGNHDGVMYSVEAATPFRSFCGCLVNVRV